MLVTIPYRKPLCVWFEVVEGWLDRGCEPTILSIEELEKEFFDGGLDLLKEVSRVVTEVILHSYVVPGFGEVRYGVTQYVEPGVQFWGARVDGLCEAAMATVLTTEVTWIVQSDDVMSRRKL